MPIKSEYYNAWYETLRPRTLPLALASIITGSALAYVSDNFQWHIALLTLLSAALLQILSNLANDYGDATKGSDTAERLGPLRGIQKGVLSLAQLKRGLIVSVIASALSCVALIFCALQSAADIMSFLALTVLAIVAAITYTVGAKPYGYMGLGDISVLIFFGWLAVGGTYYLQAGSVGLALFLPATASGLLAVGVLNANNMRDIESDAASGKHTFALKLGAVRARKYHGMLLIAAFACFAGYALLQGTASVSYWLFLVAVPLATRHQSYVTEHLAPADMRPMLGAMVKIALVANVLFSAGLLLAK